MAKPSNAIRFVEEVEALFSSTLSDEKLLKLSEGFKKQYTEALAHNPACMLPSFNYALPTGKEEGTFIALDVGGSTFRVAALRLFVPEGQERGESEWLAITSFKIDDEVKSFDGEKFFAWLAEKIAETLEKYHIAPKEGEKFAMGLAWSFPIEHTGLRSGKIQGMGKGFKASESLLGTCLADTVQAACDTLVSYISSCSSSHTNLTRTCHSP
jgi:hexokinase